LFKAASQALDKVATNPKFLGAQTGAVAILHTWGQALTYHPHIHMIVPAGGLSADGVEWVRSGKKFFVPVKALSKVFRGVLWTLLEKELKLKTIQLPDNIATLAELKKQIYAKNWHVYTKKSMASPQSVVQYLGKYTHRVAISNSRLVSIDNGKVTFRWKNYRTGSNNQLMSLEGEEFIARFLRHILPSGFCKIRYYGILACANGHKKKKCVAMIAKPVNVSLMAGLSSIEVLEMVLGKDLSVCPKCKKGKLLPHTILDPV
jgi:hypothetical protein